ncbi:sugar-binding domain-containing protein [Croceibacterium sp. TMG7-5b_MA50]|uniref:sugar-binding domain-containing protein n=1 Tax=Croceibacterium sp. TMG7-5b_MA50 TaxID=3121290 RepID=UPI0032221298
MNDLTVDRRTFVALLGASAVFPGALHARSAPSVPEHEGAISLAGEWRFALDPADVGSADYWFNKVMPSDLSIRLPGILQTQGFGNEIEADTQFVAALPRDMRWYLLPQYEPYTRPGNVKVPYLSQPIRHYLGVAWYQRDIEVPAEWAGKRVMLHLERTRWRTDAWIGNRPVGSDRSLVAPHEFDLGIMEPGTHRLTLRIDNSMQEPVYRPDGHGVTDGTGTTWNGVVGRIELSATAPVWLDDVQVFPDLAARLARVQIRIGNVTGATGSGTVNAGGVSVPVSWTAEGGEATIEVPMRNPRPWSEFDPHLHTLAVTLDSPAGQDRRDVTFGMREITTDGHRILLNGEVLDMRGTHDAGAFPLTGYPATDLETWQRIIAICQEWGLNGMRFHSWCPPEAAFIAADRMGFYLQPECAMWNNFDAGGRMLAVLHDETARLIRAYGNHPSFILMGSGNEPAGQFHAQLPGWDERWKAADPRRLYTDGTGRHARAPGGPGTPFAADFLVVGSTVRGPRGWFGEDYEEELQELLGGVAQPVISHETGQWCAYPDLGLIDKFSGQSDYAAFPHGIDTGDVPYMVPGNYEIMRDFAAAHGLLDLNRQFAHASGRFQLACYKEELEANLRTPSHSGFQMLDLHDYLGQGGALMGLLDAFWEPKGYVDAPEWREFCSATVPLVRLKDRTFTSDRMLEASAELYHHGPRPLRSVRPRWRIMDTAGKTVQSGDLPARAAPRGKAIPLGTISADLSRLPAPAAYELVVELAGTAFRNRWRFWVYPPAEEVPQPAGVVTTADWAEARAALAAGGRVLFLSGNPAEANPDLAMTTVPIFWNRLMNPSRAWMLGLLNDAAHPALAGFPTQDHCDWQWVDLIGATTAMNVEALPPDLRPIVQPIDDWNRSLRTALLFEARVGPGRLIASAFDLTEQGTAGFAGGPALRRSVLDYMASDRFSPALALNEGTLATWIDRRHVAPATVITPPDTGDVIDPGQVRT